MVETIIETESRYEQLLKIDLLMLVRRGFVPVHLMDWKQIYETYLNELQLAKKNKTIGSVGVAQQATADEFKLSLRHIQNVINYMTN